MFYYKIGDRMTEEMLNKFVEQIPSQAGAILIAAYELGAKGKETREKVSEVQIAEHIKKNMERLNKGARGETEEAKQNAVDTFVIYYRKMLKSLPSTMVTTEKDNIGDKARPGRAVSRPVELIDPITNQPFPNMFQRKAKTKNSRPTIAVSNDVEEEEDIQPELQQ